MSLLQLVVLHADRISPDLLVVDLRDPARTPFWLSEREATELPFSAWWTGRPRLWPSAVRWSAGAP